MDIQFSIDLKTAKFNIIRQYSKEIAKSFLVREFDNLCNDVSLVDVDLPSRKDGLDMFKVLAVAELDEPGYIGIVKEMSREF